MKIKSDFVTNSSSTSYIVLFPEKRPVITLKNVIEAAYQDISPTQRNDKNLNILYNAYQIGVQENINKMFKGYDTIYEEEILSEFFKKHPELDDVLGNFDFYLFSTLVEVLYAKGLVIDSQSLNGEGNTMILVLDRERVIQVLKNEIQK